MLKNILNMKYKEIMYRKKNKNKGSNNIYKKLNICPTSKYEKVEEKYVNFEEENNTFFWYQFNNNLNINKNIEYKDRKYTI